MISIIQRVTKAAVTVDGKRIAAIQQGIVALVAVERADTGNQAKRLAERLLNFRIFADKEGKMNLNLIDINGGLLLVPQFTLAADTRKGTRPSFTPAAPPEKGLALFNQLVEAVAKQHRQLACGKFGADMQVHLINDGPVTFTLRVPPPKL